MMIWVGGPSSSTLGINDCITKGIKNKRSYSKEVAHDSSKRVLEESIFGDETTDAEKEPALLVV